MLFLFVVAYSDKDSVQPLEMKSMLNIPKTCYIIYRDFSAVKTEFNFVEKNDDLNIFVQNIDCGYTLEPPCFRSTHNLCFG